MARRYSQRTIKLYLYHHREFLRFSKKNHYEMSNADVRAYPYHLANDKGVATSTLNTAINALKFYFGKVLKPRFVYVIRRPKKDKKYTCKKANNTKNIIVHSRRHSFATYTSTGKWSRLTVYSRTTGA